MALLYILLRRAVQSLNTDICQQFPRLFFIHPFGNCWMTLLSEQMKNLFLTTQLSVLVSAYLAGNLSSVSPAELFWQLRPFIPLHRIRLKDKSLLFLPPGLSLDTTVLEGNEEVVYVEEVIYIMLLRNGSLLLLLHNGFVLLLSHTRPIRKWICIYPQMYYMGNGIGKWFVYLRLFWSEILIRRWFGLSSGALSVSESVLDKYINTCIKKTELSDDDILSELNDVRYPK